MASTSVEAQPAAASMGLPARLIGIITAPADTFRSVVAQPRWFGMLAVSVLVAVVLTGGFMMTEVGQNAWLDQIEAAGTPPEQMAAMERMAPMVGYFTAGAMLVSIPAMLLIVAGIVFAVFNAALGGTATFKQIFAVVVHTAPIGILAQLFTIPLNYVRESLTSSTSLAVMLPMLEANSLGARLAAWVDLFVIWQLVVLAIGLGVLYRRRTQPIALTVLSLYFLVALIASALAAR